ncbi:MAG: hypothetical protein AAF352_02770, partial [Pseudomonadota bacterium]
MGKLKALKQGTGTLNITLPGRADLAAEGKITLTDFEDGTAAPWVISTAEHHITQEGYICKIRAETPTTVYPRLHGGPGCTTTPSRHATDVPQVNLPR